MPVLSDLNRTLSKKIQSIRVNWYPIVPNQNIENILLKIFPFTTVCSDIQSEPCNGVKSNNTTPMVHSEYQKIGNGTSEINWGSEKEDSLKILQSKISQHCLLKKGNKKILILRFCFVS
jgi:hypothetical protein